MKEDADKRNNCIQHQFGFDVTQFNLIQYVNSDQSHLQMLYRDPEPYHDNSGRENKPFLTGRNLHQVQAQGYWAIDQIIKW